MGLRFNARVAPNKSPYEAGFRFHNLENSWPDDANSGLERLPNDWLKDSGGISRLKKNYAKYLPEKVFISPDGLSSDDGLAFFNLKNVIFIKTGW